MAAGKSVIKVLIDGDTKGIDQALGKTESKIGAFTKNAAKSFAVMGAAVVAGGAIIGKKLIEAGEAASTSNARIRNIAESMGLFGDQAKVVSDRLVKLAEKTALNTGVDQNAIKMTQAKLLTFGQLAASADKIGGAFDRATQAAIDMAASGFGEAEGNAVQLGKALQDPIKGITALNKSGITFTATEREMIKAMVEAGDVGSAQAMILEAIEKQVGGTAAATANASDKMKVAFSQLQERLGQRLLPVFERFTKFLVNKLIPAGERLANRWGPIIAEAFRSVADAVGPVIKAIGEKLAPVLDRIGKFFEDNTELVKTFFTVMAGGVVLGAIIALGAALGALLSPAVLITAGIAALVAGIQYAYTNFEGFRDVVDTTIRVVRQVVTTFVTVVKSLWADFGDEIIAVARAAWGFVQAYVERVVTIVRAVVSGFVSAVTYVWSRWGEEIKATATKAWEFIRIYVETALNVIRGVIQTVTALIKGDWSGAWQAIKDTVKAGVDGVVQFVAAIPGRITAVASGAFDGLKNAFKSAINYIIRAWNGLEFRIPGFDPPGPGPKFDGFKLGVPKIPLLAAGGIVTGPTLAMVGEAGPEAVIPLDRAGGMLGGTTVINITTGADPQAVIAAIKKFERANGTNWRS